MTDKITDPRIAAWCEQRIRCNDDPVYQENVRRFAAIYDEAARVHVEVARRRRFIASGAPERCWKAVCNPRPFEAFEAARWHLTTARRECAFLLLAGPRGRGKTTALSWAVTEGGGLYVTAESLVAAGTYNPVWRILGHAAVVAIDGFDMEAMNETFRASMFDLLDTRYGNLRRTLIATNLDGEAFRRRYCPDVGDRLFERLTKGGRWVNLPGESMRRHWQDEADPAT